MQEQNKIRRPFNLKKWIDENRSLLKPPVGNKCVYEDADFIVQIVGGPNARKDYHWEHGEELFYQLEGDMKLRIQENGGPVDILIKEGDIFLLPPKIPHCPIRSRDTVGLVVEKQRSDPDKMIWYCEQCNHLLFEKEFVLKDITTQFLGIFKEFYESIELRTCNCCAFVMVPPT